MRRDVSERDFQAQVIDLARLHGWWVFHPHDSRHSASGWPDLTCVRDRLLLVELKTDSGRLTGEQAAVHALLAGAGHPVVVLRPRDLAVAPHLFRHGVMPDA